ncbi:hypothetical protein LPICM02_270018 [Pseudolactococcus piscium]|nr:hypothetical protein LPICM02_270018 [Lactococcus piscium]
MKALAFSGKEVRIVGGCGAVFNNRLVMLPIMNRCYCKNFFAQYENG